MLACSVDTISRTQAAQRAAPPHEDSRSCGGRGLEADGFSKWVASHSLSLFPVISQLGPPPSADQGVGVVAEESRVVTIASDT